jgi:putative zinc finger protein
MSNSTCPDLILISQFLDKELSEGEALSLRTHLVSCPACNVSIQQMQRAKDTLRTALHYTSSRFLDSSNTSECLSPEVIAAYARHVLPAEVEVNVEHHLQTCDLCVSEVSEASRIPAILTAGTKVPVPATLKAKIEAAWENAPVQPLAVSLSRLVIQIARKGIELVEHHLVEPLFDIQQTLVPLPAYRTEEALSALDLKIQAGQAEIRATTFPEGDGVSLELTLLGNTQEALIGQRVFLRQGGRSIFSARTDNEGSLRTPHLQPGTYEVTCSGIATSFQIELRA